MSGVLRASDARAWKLRAIQVGLTFLVYAAASKLGSVFQVEVGVSVFYPAAAVDVIACMHYGVWGAIGIFLGALATPWSPDELLWQTATSGLLNVMIGMVPYLVFRFVKNLYADLRDMRSFTMFLFFGTVLNVAVSALIGNILLIPYDGPGLLSWRGVAMWWVSDFSAALMLGVPLLAFAGGVFERIKPERTPVRQTTLATALKITIVIILLGWSASTMIQNFLADSLENTRIEQERLLSRASSILSETHRNLDDAARERLLYNPSAGESLRSLRIRHEKLIAELEALAPSISPELTPLVARLVAVGEAAFAPADPESIDVAPALMRETFFSARTELEKASARMWNDFSSTNARIRLVSFLMDQTLLLVLILASVNLVLNVSRPLARLHEAVEQMESEVPFDSETIETDFVELGGLATAIHDTSERLREREEQLRFETDRALEASKAKTEFLAKMSHELRTPLNSIIGFSDLMLEQYEYVPDEKRRRFLENIDGSGRHLLRLINDLLDIARVEAGRMEFVFERVDLQWLVARVVATTAPIFSSKHQTVSVEMSDQNLVTTGDAGRLDQVVMNLLSNANKFSPEGATITVSGWREEGNCVLAVRDEGIGIDQADHDRIFDEFEQVSPLGINTQGAGLGLALVKRLVEAHGGTVTLDSDAGKGSTFMVTLPLAREDDEEQFNAG